MDLFESFRRHDHQAHFVFSHLSTLTHDYFNHGGYADKVFSDFLGKIFRNEYHKDSLIILFSDHGLRFGNIVYTKSGIYEQRLPYFYIYVPDSMKIESMDAKQLREMVKANQRKLTSHIDVHATLMHLLLGTPSTEEPFGLSLFAHIPDNRTCLQAGISAHYCMCGTFVTAPITSEVNRIASQLVNITNQLLQPVSELCAQMTLNQTTKASIRQNELDSRRVHYLLQWQVNPSMGRFESTVLLDLDETGKATNLTVVGDISRIDKYGHQAKCVSGKPTIERFCYCTDNQSKSTIEPNNSHPNVSTLLSTKP